MATNSQIIAFIKNLSALAIKECNRRIANGLPFILPSICIAQSAHETGWGTAGIMTKANGYFGVKAGGSWTGKVYRADTWEVADGVAYNTVANFRAYDSPEESLLDYYHILTTLPRYSKALSYGSDSSKWLTPRETITALWQGGYATDSVYVAKIMDYIEPRNLTQYDAMITGEDSGSYIGAKLLNMSDLVDGQLKIIDSGRAIELDPSVKNAKATSWDKAIEVETETTFKIHTDFKTLSNDSTSENYAFLEVVTLTGDVATITTGLWDGASVTIPAGSKVGVNLVYQGENDLTSILAKEDAITLSDPRLPDGAKVNTTGIAYFIKIE